MRTKSVARLIQAAVPMFGLVLVLPMSAAASDLRGQWGPAPPVGSQEQRSWSHKLPGWHRFALVLDAQAVLDKETGLVWERSPDTTASDWFAAHDQCKRKTWGTRMGWRLPTIEELSSLVDPSVPYPGPTLPGQHPFTGVQTWKYWSATTLEDPTGLNWAAWGVDFDRGGVDYAGKINGNVFHWCVRGGQGVDAPVTQ